MRGAVRVPSTSKSARTPAFLAAAAIAARPLDYEEQRTKQRGNKKGYGVRTRVEDGGGSNGARI